MEQVSKVEHNGYTISATSLKQRTQNWTAFLVIEKDGFVVFCGENSYALPSRAAAEHRAITIGKGIANGDLLGLS